MSLHGFTLVLVACFVPPTAALASHQKVGRLVSPVEFGVIHYFRGPGDLEVVLTHNERWLAVIRQMEERAPEPYKSQLRSLDKKLAKKQRRQALEVDEITHLMTRNTKEGRTKRVAPLIIGAGAALVAMGAISVVSLGFGVGSQYQLDSLEDRVNEQRSGQERLLAKLEDHAERAQRNFERLNATLSGFQWEIRVDNAKRGAARESDILDRALSDYRTAFYQTLAGLLHPAFVTPEELGEGIEQMRTEAATKGMQPVPFEQPLEAFFSMPVSAVLNETGLSLYVSVPLVPIAAPMFEVLRLVSPPLAVSPGVFVQLVPERDMLVIDERRALHAEVSAADLAACHRFQDTYFCRIHTFERSPRSCAAALLTGDKATASQVCKKQVWRKPVVVLPAANESFAVDVWSSQAQTIVILCPGGQEQRMQRVEGMRRFATGPGCVLRTSTTTTFQASTVADVQVATRVPYWLEEELLDGVDQGEVSAYMDTLLIEDVAVDFDQVRASVVAARSWGRMWMGLGLVALTLGTIGGALLTRYGFLWRRVRRERVASSEPTNEGGH